MHLLHRLYRRGVRSEYVNENDVLNFARQRQTTSNLCHTCLKHPLLLRTVQKCVRLHARAMVSAISPREHAAATQQRPS